MGENSDIAWCSHTFNPWMGCAYASPGCAHCYARQFAEVRYGWVRFGGHGTRKRTSDANWRQPLAWNRKAEREGQRQKVFCASLADVFEDRAELVPWREDVFRLMAQTPNLDWLLLTKRPQNIKRMMPKDGLPPNVWLGTTVEIQQVARRRITALKAIPSAVHFLSCEPLLGPLPDLDLDGIGWVIVGGESGPGARPLNLDWVRDLRDQCQRSKAAFSFKQLSGFHPEKIPQLDGQVWAKWPKTQSKDCQCRPKAK